MKTTELETQRLRLRIPKPSDRDLFIRLYADPDVMKYIPPKGQPAGQNEALQRLNTHIDHWNAHGYGMFVVELKATSSRVGYCGLRYLKEIHGIELGYIIDKPYWGKGIASEAAEACVAFARDDLNADRVISVTNPENLGSQRLLIKIGFRRCDALDGIYHGMEHRFFSLNFT